MQLVSQIVFLLSVLAGEPAPVAFDELLENQEPGAIELEGWLRMDFEGHAICDGFDPAGSNCIWIEVAGPSKTAEALRENCLEILRWHSEFHGRRVLLEGEISFGRSGHMGVYSAEVSNPRVVRVLEQPSALEPYEGTCHDAIRALGLASNKLLQLTAYGGS
ncbi:MAG: hypothetical protein AAGI88_13800 [Pseudomonadota bacterium]